MIVDYCLPGMSGDELCRRVRMNINTRAIPIIMLTADEDEETEVRGLDSGADDFFKKSADTEILVDSHSRDAGTAPTQPDRSCCTTSLPFGGPTSWPSMTAKRTCRTCDACLQGEGYSVDAVTDPKEALASSGSVVLRPGAGGPRDARTGRHRRLSADRRDAQHLDNPIAVLMLTGREAKEDLTRALEAGADDFVGKSSDQAVLKGRIRALLRRKFFQEENQRILEELKNKELEAITRPCRNRGRLGPCRRRTPAARRGGRRRAAAGEGGVGDGQRRTACDPTMNCGSLRLSRRTTCKSRCGRSPVSAICSKRNTKDGSTSKPTTTSNGSSAAPNA